MTTTVKIEAHCASDKEVKVSVVDVVNSNIYEEFTLQDGEQASRVVYDNREICVSEVLK